MKTLSKSIIINSIKMKKVLLSILVMGTLLPFAAEAGSSPEGISRGGRNFSPEGRRKPRCKTHGKVVVCRMPRPRKCTSRRPCVPPGYYRPNPPIVIPMGR